MSFSPCEFNNLIERENRNPNFISSTYFIFLSSLTKPKGKTMEWNSLKDHRVANKAIRDCNNNNNITTNNDNSQNSSNKLKDSWISNGQSCGEDYPGGFSWPPRSYTCSFCKREFRSAQALGGHMNVHRRDRARLRQSPPRDGQYPFLNLNVKPNPNPNISNPPPVSPSFTRTLPSQVSPPVSSLSSPSSASPSEMKKCGVDGTLTDSISQAGSDLNKNKSFKCFLGVNESNGFTEEDGCHQVPKKPAEISRLDLEIGLIRDSKEDLDLELRLGYS